MSDYNGEVLADNPLGFWIFNDASGATSSDLSGHARDATYASVGYRSAGPNSLLPYAVSLVPASSAYISIPSGCIPSVGTNLDFSVEMWVQIRTYADWARFYDFGIDHDNNNLLAAPQANAINGGDFVVENYVGSSTGGEIHASKPSLTNWHHVVVTMAHNPSNSSQVNVSIYVDSVRTATGITGAVNAVTRTNNFFGRSNWVADAYFDGLFAAAATYPTALSQARVTAHYAAITATHTAATATLTRTRSATAHATELAVEFPTSTLSRTRTTTAHATALSVLFPTVTATRTRMLPAHGTALTMKFPTGTLSRAPSLLGHAISGSRPPNDLPYNATWISGISGSVACDDQFSSVDAFDPPLPGPVGTVWYVWQPGAVGKVTASVTGNTRIEGYLVNGDWIWIPGGVTSYYGLEYIRVYKVHVPADAPHLKWTGPPGSTTEITFYIDFYSVWPGDVSANGYAATPDTYTGGFSSPGVPFVADFGPISAGDYYIVAQQYDPHTDAGGNPLDVPLGWDPATDIGTFTDLVGNPVAAPFTVTDQVVLGLAARGTLAAVGNGDNSASWSVRSGELFGLRVYPKSEADESPSLTLSWLETDRTINMSIGTPTLTSTPANLVVSILDEPPGEVVFFTLGSDPTVIASATIDSTGSLSILVPVPSLANGTYTLHAQVAAGIDGSASFTVAAAPATTPSTPPNENIDPVPPTPVTPPATRWMLEDPTDGTTLTFVLNPTGADSTNLARLITAHNTTAIDGQPILFEGARQAKTWKFTGTVQTLTDRQALESWVAKPYRVYISDDFGVTYIIKLVNVTMTPVRDINEVGNHKYEATCLLYGKASP